MVYDYSKGNQLIAYDTAAGHVRKTRQVVMLYDGMIAHVGKALEAMKEKRIQDRFNCLNAAGQIINGLEASLDFEQGAEVSQALQTFYNQMFIRMMRCVRENDTAQFESIIKDLREMREAWEEVDRQYLASQEGSATAKTARAVQDAVADAAAYINQGSVSVSA